jgi:transcriptional regulator with XRE-family HTH domain
VTTAQPTQFGAWLRDRMTTQQRSYRRVAARAGLDHTTLYRIVNGSDPSLATAKRLVRALGYELRLQREEPLHELPQPEAMGAGATARALGIHVNTLKRMDPETLPFFRVTSRGDRRYLRADVKRYIRARQVVAK